MKTLITNPHQLLVIFLLTIVLQSCSTEVGTYKNNQIKSGTRDDLHKLANQLFDLIRADNTKDMQGMEAKEILDDQVTETLAHRISHEMRVDSFVRFNEYYVVNKFVEADTIKALDEGINSHRIIYPGNAREMYIVQYLPLNKNVPNKSIITAIFSRYDYGWKLSKLDLALYTLNGKTGPEIYKLAQQHYAKGYLASAASFMQQAINVARPTDVWKYEVENDMYKFASKVTTEANDKYLFPFPIHQVSTEPLIIGIYSNNTDEGTFPSVAYQTKIKLSNVDALKKEEQQVKAAINTLMPGLTKDRKYLYFAAYNELPSATKNVQHYDIKEAL